MVTTRSKWKSILRFIPLEVVEVRDSNGNSTRVKIKYHGLPSKCGNCGRFFHFLNHCTLLITRRGQRLQILLLRSFVFQRRQPIYRFSLLNYRVSRVLDSEVQVPMVGQSAKAQKRAKSRALDRVLSKSHTRATNTLPKMQVGKCTFFLISLSDENFRKLRKHG